MADDPQSADDIRKQASHELAQALLRATADGQTISIDQYVEIDSRISLAANRAIDMLDGAEDGKTTMTIGGQTVQVKIELPEDTRFYARDAAMALDCNGDKKLTREEILALPEVFAELHSGDADHTEKTPDSVRSDTPAAPKHGR